MCKGHGVGGDQKNRRCSQLCASTRGRCLYGQIGVGGSHGSRCPFPCSSSGWGIRGDLLNAVFSAVRCPGVSRLWGKCYLFLRWLISDNSDTRRNHPAWWIQYVGWGWEAGVRYHEWHWDLSQLMLNRILLLHLWADLKPRLGDPRV